MLGKTIDICKDESKQRVNFTKPRRLISISFEVARNPATKSFPFHILPR
jgi:hypothetical protein